MKFAPSGAAQLSGRPRERFDGRIAQRYRISITKFREISILITAYILKLSPI